MEQWLNRAEIAEHMGVSVRTVDMLIRRGDLPAVRIAGSRKGTRISVSALDEWLAKQPKATA